MSRALRWLAALAAGLAAGARPAASQNPDREAIAARADTLLQAVWQTMKIDSTVLRVAPADTALCRNAVARPLADSVTTTDLARLDSAAGLLESIGEARRVALLRCFQGLLQAWSTRGRVALDALEQAFVLWPGERATLEDGIATAAALAIHRRELAAVTVWLERQLALVLAPGRAAFIRLALAQVQRILGQSESARRNIEALGAVHPDEGLWYARMQWQQGDFAASRAGLGLDKDDAVRKMPLERVLESAWLKQVLHDNAGARRDYRLVLDRLERGGGSSCGPGSDPVVSHQLFLAHAALGNVGAAGACRAAARQGSMPGSPIEMMLLVDTLRVLGAACEGSLREGDAYQARQLADSGMAMSRLMLLPILELSFTGCLIDALSAEMRSAAHDSVRLERLRSDLSKSAERLDELNGKINNTIDDKRSAEQHRLLAVLEKRASLAAQILFRRPLSREELIVQISLHEARRPRLRDDPPPPIGVLQNRTTAVIDAVLARRGAVLLYLAHPDHLRIWLLHSGGIWFSSQPISRCRLQSLVLGYRASLGTLAGHDHTEPASLAEAGIPDLTCGREAGGVAASEAAARLLPPGLGALLPEGAELLIVPHGVLGLVPFAALPTPGLRGVPMGLRYALRFAPMLSSDSAPGSGGRTRPIGPNRLVVANPAMPPGYASLRGAHREGIRVSRLTGARLLTGRRASESSVRRYIGEAHLVHLASHGHAETTIARANASFLVLAAEPGQDGRMTMADILTLPRMQADLVVLSACRTGDGAATFAEGVIGLAAAFLDQGARSVLVSLWDVPDQATELLMRRFYEHWLHDADRPNKAQSLRRAQRDVWRVAAYRRPLYWAGFVLIGDS